mgnify:CR=1 FL=1|tara:strand:+ start:14120 stop:17887 length:3768 start_codon:yes stop_codon:yes gene_type:complete
MEFVEDGPDVPERLLQAHEEGNVVFFCGAGIAIPAGLPSFGSLVNKLYDELGVIPDGIQKMALSKHQYDTAISLLESVNDNPTWRTSVREKMAQLLVPTRTGDKATRTHNALLELSRTPKKQTRLITTNFDKIFEGVIKEKSLKIRSFQAPLLPVPKSRWDGLVYLHGLLPDDNSAADLDQLVVSSGDFGLAYLTERWAARFVSELFRSYTVCFIGYSLDDPILRYMMDALAADKLLGENPPEMFAFGSYSSGKYDDEYQRWKSKNVTPILYKMKSHHFNLHETLVKWSEIYRDGLNGKQQIVVTTAFTNPSLTSQNEYNTKRLVWALSDSTGFAAKTFSTMVPSPPLLWLFAFDTFELFKRDLSRFDVLDSTFDASYKFSLLDRPAKSSLAQNMSFLRAVPSETKLDPIMRHLVRWLTTHMDNPDLILYICNRGGRLHFDFEKKVRHELQEQLERRSCDDTKYFQEKAKISNEYAVSKEMFAIWDLLLNGYLSNDCFSTDLYSWSHNYRISGLSIGLKRELLRILTPRVLLKKRSGFWNESSTNPFRALFDWEFALNTSSAHSGIANLKRHSPWVAESSELIFDFSLLLQEVMELRVIFHEVSEKEDFSYLYQPSIKEHEQNKDFRDWTVLIELTRDSWLALNNKKPSLAAKVASDWWLIPFPIFKRLALFAASEKSAVLPEIVIEWLSEDNSYWLWNLNTQREVLQLLPNLHGELSLSQLNRLIDLIVKGPSREMFRDDLTDEEFIDRKSRGIWLRLEKLENSGLELGEDASDILIDIKNKYPKWKFSEDGSDEFPVWTGGQYLFDQFEETPADFPDLLRWLEENKDFDHWAENDWSARCENDFQVTSDVLITLYEKNVLTPEAWRGAIRIWAEDSELNDLAWTKIHGLLLGAGVDLLAEISWDLCRWIERRLKNGKLDEYEFMQFFDLLVKVPHEVDIDQYHDPLNAAINHPIGMMTENLFKWWYTTKPQGDGGINSTFRLKIQTLLNTPGQNSYFAKAIITSNLLQLYRADAIWTESTIMTWFDWEDNELSTLSWRSFLWSAKLHRGLLSSLKPYFLATASHFSQLNTQSERYAQLLTYTALQQYPEYKLTDFAEPVKILPEDGLQQVASSLEDGLSNSGEKRSEYWNNRVKPFLKKVWPKEANINEETVNQLALLCIEAREHFDEAFNILKHFLYHTRYNDHVITTLGNTNILEKFPESALLLIDMIIGEPEYRPACNLEPCLAQIRAQKPDCANMPEFIRLWQIVQCYR